MNAADIAAVLFLAVCGWFALSLLCCAPFLLRLVTRR